MRKESDMGEAGWTAYADVDFLIMAAGASLRMDAGVRKQWLPLCGKPLFLYTVTRLVEFGADSVLLVVHPDDEEQTQEALAAAGLEICRVTPGGRDRQESVWCGLRQTTRRFVAVHDAARPFVCKEDVATVVERARMCGAATLGYPVRDTLKRVDHSLRLQETIARENAWHVQTPQVFSRELLEGAHLRAARDGFVGTDDTMLVERLGGPVDIVRGSAWNVKITDRDDMFFMRLWEASLCGLD